VPEWVGQAHLWHSTLCYSNWVKRGMWQFLILFVICDISATFWFSLW